MPVWTTTPPLSGADLVDQGNTKFDALDTAIAAKAPIANPTFTGTVTLGGAPTSALHAATKAYADNIAAGFQPKDSVVAATTGNITLSNSQTVDGVAVVNPNRVLVKNQSAQAENGIYVVTNSGAWVRATDMDAWSEVQGALVAVTGGSVNGSSTWVAAGASGGTLGTTAITWSLFSQSTAATSATTTGTFTARAFADRFADWVNVKDHRLDNLGATRTDVDMINAALEYAYQNSKATVYIPPGNYELRMTGSDAQGEWALYNKGISIEAKGVVFYAHSTLLGASCDWMRLANLYMVGFTLRGFTMTGYIGSSFSSANRRGRYGIAYHGWQASGITKMVIQDVSLLDGFPTRALFLNNDPSVNLQGTPATSHIDNCVFFGGVYFHGAGDSLSIHHSTIRARVTTPAVHFTCTDGAGGYASQFALTHSNLVAGGGILYVGRARTVLMEQNNCEMNIWVGQDGVTNAAGTGSNAAMVDIDGSIGTVFGATIRDNMLSNQAGTVSYLIRAASARFVHIDNIRGYSTSAVDLANLTAASNFSTIGPNNSINDVSVVFPRHNTANDVTDAATGTRYATYKAKRTSAAITVGASPFTHTNNTAYPVLIMVAPGGGNVTAVSTVLQGIGHAAPYTYGYHPLGPSDTLTVTWDTVAPGMREIYGLL